MESIVSWWEFKKDDREGEVTEIQKGEVEYFNLAGRINVGSGEDFALEYPQ